MNHDERRHVIAKWLHPSDGFLRRYKAPAGMEGALADELVELVDAINGALPILPNADSVGEFLGRVGRHVASQAKTRSWPMQREFIEAVRAIRERPVPEHDGGETLDAYRHAYAVRYASEWFHRHGMLPSWWNRRAVTDDMIEQGLATWEELKAAHADVEPRDRPRDTSAIMEAYRHD